MLSGGAHLVELIRVNDDSQTTELRQPELLLVYARVADLRAAFNGKGVMKLT